MLQYQKCSHSEAQDPKRLNIDGFLPSSVSLAMDFEAILYLLNPKAKINFSVKFKTIIVMDRCHHFGSLDHVYVHIYLIRNLP